MGAMTTGRTKATTTRTGTREEAGSRASCLDSVREEKRGVMRDLVKLVKHEGRQADTGFITFKI